MKKIFNKWLGKLLIRKLKDIESEAVLKFYSHNVLLTMQKYGSTEIDIVYTIEVDGVCCDVVTTSKLIQTATIDIKNN